MDKLREIDVDKELRELYHLIDSSDKDDLARIKLKLDILERLTPKQSAKDKDYTVTVKQKPYPTESE
jgi:uncharacterized protein YacL